MTEEMMWSMAQDIVDTIIENEMIKPERYEVSMAVAQLQQDLAYSLKNDTVGNLWSYLNTLSDTIDETDGEKVELVNDFRGIIFDIMHSKVMEV